MTMIELFYKLSASVHSCGKDTIEDSTLKYIHQPLERELLHIYPNYKRKLFVFSDNLTI